MWNSLSKEFLHVSFLCSPSSILVFVRTIPNFGSSLMISQIFYKYQRDAEQITQLKQQIPLTNDKADELAKRGALLDWVEFAEELTQDTDNVRLQICASIVCATTCHCGVRDLVDTQEITEEMKQRPEWRSVWKEKKDLSTEWSRPLWVRSCINVSGVAREAHLAMFQTLATVLCR